MWRKAPPHFCATDKLQPCGLEWLEKLVGKSRTHLCAAGHGDSLKFLSSTTNCPQNGGSCDCESHSPLSRTNMTTASSSITTIGSYCTATTITNTATTTRTTDGVKSPRSATRRTARKVHLKVIVNGETLLQLKHTWTALPDSRSSQEPGQASF